MLSLPVNPPVNGWLPSCPSCWNEGAGKVGEKGRSRLEYLNGYIPPVAGRKKKLLCWEWLLLLLAIGIAIFFAMRKPASEVKEKVVEKVV